MNKKKAGYEVIKEELVKKKLEIDDAKDRNK